MSEWREWDWPQEPKRRRPTIDYEQDRRGVYRPAIRRKPIGFGTCLLVTSVAAIAALWLAWPPLLMFAVLVGLDSPSQMFGAIVGVVILLAVALRRSLLARR
jgi:hypothetical protein